MTLPCMTSTLHVILNHHLLGAIATTMVTATKRHSKVLSPFRDYSHRFNLQNQAKHP